MTEFQNAAQKAWATRRARKAQATSAVQLQQPTGFCDAGAIATMPDQDLLALFHSVGAAVSARFLQGRPVLSSWDLVLGYLKSAMAFRPVEDFRVLFLDKRNNLIADEVLSIGTIDHCPVYPREVAKRALELGACALILSHNHPSGDPKPSNADIQMTRMLVDVLKPLGIVVHDHVIVGRDGNASLKKLGLI